MSIKKSSKSDVSELIDRIKSLLSLKRDYEVADLFGITPNDLSNRKKRGTLEKIAISWATEENINLDWLIHGRGDPHDENKQLNVRQSNPNYDPHGGWQPPNIEKIAGFPADHEIWRAYKLLHEIYESGEDVFIRAIFSNLVAFYNATQQQKEIAENKKRLSKVEKVVKLFNRKPESERRKIINPDFPAEKERRRGKDRRKR